MPHPATMFLLLTMAVVFLSWICDIYGLKVTLPQTGEDISSGPECSEEESMRSLSGLLKPSYIPEREQRELRDLTRYRNKLIEHVSSEKNRIVRILEDCNIKLSSVVCSLDGVVANKLIDMLIDKGHVTMDDITCIYHKKLEASPELLYQACEGFIEPHHIYMQRKKGSPTHSIVCKPCIAGCGETCCYRKN